MYVCLYEYVSLIVSIGELSSPLCRKISNVIRKSSINFIMSSPASLPIELRIHPTGWKSGPESERYPLSLMGHIMPKVYVLVAEVFALPDLTDNDVTVENMTAGLEFAISQFPILAGVLEMDTATGRMWVARQRDSTVSLHVKYMLREGEFPSYKELAEKEV